MAHLQPGDGHASRVPGQTRAVRVAFASTDGFANHLAITAQQVPQGESVRDAAARGAALTAVAVTVTFAACAGRGAGLAALAALAKLARKFRITRRGT